MGGAGEGGDQEAELKGGAGLDKGLDAGHADGAAVEEGQGMDLTVGCPGG